MGKYAECKKWNSRINTFFTELDICNLNYIEHTTNQPAVMEYINTILGDYYEQFRWEALQRQEALRGHGCNKLRTYKQFKTMFSVEH